MEGVVKYTWEAVTSELHLTEGTFYHRQFMF